jgi:tRNA threonylcarbamoyladenosine biosynthesis protein TsaE
VPSVELSRDELVRWGEALGASLRAPATLTFEGDLGAGKTTLVQAICAGLGVREDVTSPTYGIVHQYASRAGRVWHFDLYRLRRAEELRQIGWDDAMTSGEIVLVEWPEIAAAELPRSAQRLKLKYVASDESRRRLTWPEGLA